MPTTSATVIGSDTSSANRSRQIAPARASDAAERHTLSMADTDIQQHINTLIEEEHQLRSSVGAGELSPTEEQQLLRQVETELDRCWDLLRARR
ncbi:MAG: DUF2630 family protein, partial [Mycobacteriales bacterium]